MAFMCRPSPVFIEIAQKIAVWNGTCASNGNWASQSYSSATTDPGAGAYYPSYFWAALVAAVERGVAGPDAAWTKVIANVANLSTWGAGFAPDPRWGTYPRNK